MTIKLRTVTRRVIDMPSLYRSIGRKMRAARQKAGLSQADVALALGVTRANIANLEAGKTRILLDHLYNLSLLVKRPVRVFLP